MKLINALLFTGLFFTSLLAIGAEQHSSASGTEKFKLIATSAEPLQVGKPAQITLSLSDIKTHSPVNEKQLQTTHTQKLHALIIDPTLTDYHHQHPTPGQKPGEYTFTFTPNTDNNYRIWLDIVPVGGKQEYVIADLKGKNLKNPPVKKTLSSRAEVEGYQFELQFDKVPLHVNQMRTGTVTIKDKDNKPFSQLEPVMGAFAHIVAFGEDYKTILHIHPMGKEPESANERGGPKIDFHMMPTEKGFVKMFAQTQIQGKEVIAPFGVDVE